MGASLSDLHGIEADHKVQSRKPPNGEPAKGRQHVPLAEQPQPPSPVLALLSRASSVLANTAFLLVVN